MRILNIITSLSTGGAEMMLYKLLQSNNIKEVEPVVVSLIDESTLGDSIKSLGIPLYSIGMKAGTLPTPLAIWKLLNIVNQVQPNLLQGWMYHGNLAAQLVSLLSRESLPVLWNIRHSVYSLSYEKRSTAAIIKLLGKLSKWPTKIIYNSQTSVVQHELLGYDVGKSIVISNGFDPKNFTPSPEARHRIREELALPNNTYLIGRIGRYHPMKDHANFLKAAAIFCKKSSNVHFLMAGRGINWHNQDLCGVINELGLVEQIHLLGERQDMPYVTAALDIAVSSSYSEAFPSVVGEAMACGVPCVVTDVGDSAWIVGDTGIVVPPHDPYALAHALEQLIELGDKERLGMGEAARKRIIEHFSLSQIVEQYEKLYQEVLEQSC